MAALEVQKAELAEMLETIQADHNAAAHHTAGAAIKQLLNTGSPVTNRSPLLPLKQATQSLLKPGSPLKQVRLRHIENQQPNPSVPTASLAPLELKLQTEQVLFSAPSGGEVSIIRRLWVYMAARLRQIVLQYKLQTSVLRVSAGNTARRRDSSLSRLLRSAGFIAALRSAIELAVIVWATRTKRQRGCKGKYHTHTNFSLGSVDSSSQLRKCILRLACLDDSAKLMIHIIQHWRAEYMQCWFDEWRARLYKAQIEAAYSRLHNQPNKPLESARIKLKQLQAAFQTASRSVTRERSLSDVGDDDLRLKILSQVEGEAQEVCNAA